MKIILKQITRKHAIKLLIKPTSVEIFINQHAVIHGDSSNNSSSKHFQLWIIILPIFVYTGGWNLIRETCNT